jgi:hypothetical protein
MVHSVLLNRIDGQSPRCAADELRDLGGLEGSTPTTQRGLENK